MTLTERINAQSKRREGSTIADPVQFTQVLGARLYGDDPFATTKACDSDVFRLYLACWVACMEASTTVAALEAVALAAEEVNASILESWDGSRPPSVRVQHSDWMRVRTALEHLTATIGADDE